MLLNLSFKVKSQNVTLKKKGQRSSRLRSDPKSGFTSSSRRSSLSSSSSSRSDAGPAKSLRLDWTLRRTRGFWWRAGRGKEQRRSSYFVCVSASSGIRLEEIQMFLITTVYHYECVCECVCVCVCVDTIVKLARLHGPKSLWETFSADCNLFREHQPSVAVSLRGEPCVCSHKHKHTMNWIYQQITCFAETVGEEMRALLLYMQVEEHSRSTDLVSVVPHIPCFFYF